MTFTITGGTVHEEFTSPSVILTSLQEIQRIFSPEGVENHTEDYSYNSEVINEIVNRASETVLQYLRTLYLPEDLETSYWVRAKATYIACYYLSARMGNPALYQDFFEQSMMELVQARDGFIDIGLPTVPRVIVQNQIVDRRSFMPLRVRNRASTHVYGGQRLHGSFHGYDY